MGGLRDRVALVTGASRGIGAGTAVALAQAGCHVACAARATSGNPQRLPGTIDETAEQCRALGVDAIALPTDLTDDAQVEAMVTQTIGHFGRLDILVNNAAVTFPGDLHLPTKRFDLIMAVNLRAPFVATRTAAPALRDGGAGRVLNISSVASLVPIPDASIYGMSKIALEHFTLDAARQLHPDGVAVNCLRIDVPVASEGYLSNASENDAETFEPIDVATEGILWMLGQPPEYTARVESMWALGQREGIMASRAKRPLGRTPPLEPFVGLYDGPDYTRFFD